MEGNDLAILTETAGLARSLIQEITSWWKLRRLGAICAGPPIQFSMVRGQVTEIDVHNIKTGTITVFKTDPDGKRLDGACFAAYRNNNGERGALVYAACDRDDEASDGITRLNSLPPDDYLVVETVTPHGYFTAEDTLVTVLMQDNMVTIVDEPWPTLTIIKLDNEDKPLKGACFELYVNNGGQRGAKRGGTTNCGVDNIIKINDQPGDYLLVESTVPQGFAPSPDIPVTFVRGEDITLEVRNLPAGKLKGPRNHGYRRWPSAQCLLRTCGQITTACAAQRFKERQRDALDGVDGTTTVEWATGTYVLVQSIKPQDHYFAPDTVVTFVNGETHEVTVLNESYPL